MEMSNGFDPARQESAPVGETPAQASMREIWQCATSSQTVQYQPQYDVLLHQPGPVAGVVAETMTPLQLDILLHYYTRPTDFDDGETVGSGAYNEFVEWMLDEDLLIRTGQDSPILRIGWRGKRFVEKLIELKP